jgi:hypothetical protein
MRKQASTDLFHLIQSLDKGEKRNFKLLARLLARGAPKRYMELFDQLEGMAGREAPDEAALAARFGDQLPNLKHYLHRLVLRSLTHFDDSPQAALTAIREQARILIAKGLAGQAKRLLERGIAEAAAKEWWEDLAALLALKAGIDDPHGQAATLQMEEEARARHRLDGGLRLLLSRVASAIRSGTCQPGSPARIALAAELLADPHMRPGPADLPVKAQLTHWRVRLALEEGTCSAAWLQAVAAIAALFDRRHPALAHIGHERLAHIALCAEARALQGDLEGAEEDLVRVEAEAAALGRPLWQLQARVATARIAIASLRGHAGQLTVALDDAATEAMALLPRLGAEDREALCLALARGHVLAGQARVALAWVRRAREAAPAATRFTVRLHILMLSIMARLDLGDHSIVWAELQSLRRLMAKRGPATAHERFFLRAVRRLCRLGDAGESLGETAGRLLDRCEAQLAGSEEFRHADRAIHFWAWLRAKADGLPPCACTWDRLAQAPA